MVPDDLLNQWRAIGKQGVAAHDAWPARLAASIRRKDFEDTINDVLPASLAPALLALKEKMPTEKPGRHAQILREGAC